jgi:DNA-3-methyladenine glycosylase II
VTYAELRVVLPLVGMNIFVCDQREHLREAQYMSRSDRRPRRAPVRQDTRIPPHHHAPTRHSPAVCDTVIRMPRAIATPRPPRYDFQLACQELTAADPKLGKLIARAGPFTLRLASTQSPFEALVQSIIYQQLHGKAAATIHRRLLESFVPPTHPGAPLIPVSSGWVGSPTTIAHPSPQHLLDCPTEQLRAAGLSHNKTLALRDLAAKTIDGTVPTLAHIRRMSDADIVNHLTQVRGIGIWTVHMMLIFRLGRPNVLPTGDYGVRKGFALTFGKLKPFTDGKPTKVIPADLPTPAEMERRAKRWHPWCSIASWYLWRACDLAATKPPTP